MLDLMGLAQLAQQPSVPLYLCLEGLDRSRLLLRVTARAEGGELSGDGSRAEKVKQGKVGWTEPRPGALDELGP